MQALDRTRLGEGRAGVYYADTGFNWRDLSVNAAQQTWSLLGGGDTDCAAEAVAQAAAAGASAGAAADGAMHEAAVSAPTSVPAPASATPPPRRAARAFEPPTAVNLHELGSSFVRAAPGADAGAWAANREALLDDFKRKRRQALRVGKPGSAKRKR
jgi:predicted component of type VI protein secretion system